MKHTKLPLEMRAYCGNGSSVDGGSWEANITPAFITLNCVRKPFFSGALPFNKTVRIKRDGNSQHGIREWGSGSFTVYPFRTGQPYVFAALDACEVG